MGLWYLPRAHVYHRPQPHERLIIIPRRAAMALVALSGDEQRILFTQLCNVLDPRVCT